MSKNEGARTAVFRTTKVRTKLMGDNWWMQRAKDPDAEPPKAQEEEKPWIAEVRASRLNGAPVESSPVASPTTDPPAVKPVAERAPPSGYLIRGVFVQTESKPASSSPANGFSRRSGSFTKRPSDAYKKIAPHTVRTAPETPVETEGQLSPEEQERRREAASNVLKTSAVRKRSYVFSAAKKYDSTEKPPDTPEVNSSPSFVAKRVEIADDDDEPSVTPLSFRSPASPVSSSPVAVPEPATQTTVETTKVETIEDEPVAPAAVVDVVPEPVKEEVPPVLSLAEDPTVATAAGDPTAAAEDPFAHMKPGCIKVFIPLPELRPECVLVEEVSKDPQPVDSDDSGREDTPPLSPVQASGREDTPPLSPVQPSGREDTPPLSPLQASTILEASVPEDAVKTDPRPHSPPTHSADTAESLDALSDTLISFDTRSTSLLDTQDENDPSDSVVPCPDSFKDAEAVLEEDKTEQLDMPSDHSIDHEPAPAVSDCIVMTEDLLSLADGPEESAAAAGPVPSSPGRWSHDLLCPSDSARSFSDQEKTSSSLDLLADDVIPINTDTRSLSTESCNDDTTSDTTTPRTEGTPPHTQDTTTRRSDDTTPCMGYTTLRTDDTTAPPCTADTAKDTQSLADPFDPFPIGSTSRASPNSSAADLTSPARDDDEEEHPSPRTSMSGDALDILAQDVIPINTDAERLSSRHSWSRSWDPEHAATAATEESPAPAPAARVEEQPTLVTFERKSAENDSPWDRWTSPTVHAAEEEEGDEDEQEEEEKSDTEDTATPVIPTISGIWETHSVSDPEPVMDRYQTYSRTPDVEETRRVETPEPESKKGCVFVKEYVDAGELSLHNARDQDGSGSEYLTSSSSYSRPSNYSRVSESSPCTYCGELVGNDAKITIDHLNISCHPGCFQCGVCSRPMGDLLYNMFLHGGKVHCESCYSKVD